MMQNAGDILRFTPYKCNLGLRNKLLRFCWGIVYCLLFRPLRTQLFNSWRLLLLRCFGAKIGKGCIVYATAEIWAPWNLEMGSFVCIAPRVICYNADKIILGSKVTVSQYSYLCTASHDISSLERPLITKPISISNFAWICADVFVGPGVQIGEGAVCVARAVVTKNVPEWKVVGGNPACYIADRNIEDAQ